MQIESTRRLTEPTARRNAWLLAQHREVAYHLRVLERLLGAPDCLVSREWREDLADWCAVAAPKIEEHIRHEEALGFYRDFEERFPRLSARLEQLRLEHKTINGLLKQADAEAADPSPELIRRLTELVHLARRHEHNENEILEEAYLDDLGGGD